jgi:hypothetical protein
VLAAKKYIYLFKKNLICKGYTKLLVVTGTGSNDTQVSEVIDLEDPENICQSLGDYKYDNVNGVSGGLLNETMPMLCFGNIVKTGTTNWTNMSSNCYLLGDPVPIVETTQ